MYGKKYTHLFFKTFFSPISLYLFKIEYNHFRDVSKISESGYQIREGRPSVRPSAHMTVRPSVGVAQLAEALHYNTEGRGFDFQWCH